MPTDDTTPIRTPDQKLRIFVSSTLQELDEERAAARRAIEHICLTPVMFELGARAHPPRDLYRAYLAQSEVFIGIYGQSYGWVAPSESISGLEDEYVLARAKPKLIYLKHADSREARLKGLIDRIRHDDGVSYRHFRDAAELEQLVKDDLALMLTERFASSAGQGRSHDGDEDARSQVPARCRPPVDRGELIGRAELMSSIAELLAQHETGCLTLTGPGGTGKTRISIHAANALADRFPDGVFYVQLESVRSGREVLPAIGSALELPPAAPGAGPETSLVTFLRRRRALVVLDNFEQVVDAASALSGVLVACPQLKLLVTSREALRIGGERELPVPPLAHDPGADAVTPAMQLFEARARDARPDFRIDDDNRASVAEICRRLDALPLAIELAAARVRVLSPQAMLPRLDKSMALLSCSRRDVPERQQTMRGALDWSYQLLSPGEMVFFRRLGVLAGSFSEACAAAVENDATIDVLDGLTSLVEKSLLVRDERNAQPRFHLLETVREFAHERLAEVGEELVARERQAVWVTQLLSDAYYALDRASTRADAHEQLALEEVNVHAALSFFSGENGDRDKAWALFCHLSLARHMESRGSEIRSTYDRLRAQGVATDPMVAAAASGLAAWASYATPSPATLQDLEGAVNVLEAHGERRFLPGIFAAYAQVLSSLEPSRAQPVLDRAVSMSVDEQLHSIESWTRVTRCLYLMTSGQLELADRAADELVDVSVKHDETNGIAFGMTAKARLHLMRGDLIAGRRAFAKAAAYVRSRSGIYGRTDALTGLASVALAQGDEVAAHAVIAELLRSSNGHHRATGTELVWGALAYLLAKAGDLDRARRVLEVIPRGVENPAPALKLQLDPTGALAKATSDARALLGDPDPLASEGIDLDAAIRAALGTNATPFATSTNEETTMQTQDSSLTDQKTRTTGPGHYNTDTAEMLAVHKALLAALGAASAYILGAGQDPARVERVASFYENVLEMLHVHHVGEDELLYPLLEQRCPESRAVLARIDAQHALLPAPMAAGLSAVAVWRADPSVGNGRAVIDAMSSISDTLRTHLTDEEATVLPMASKWISPEEFGRLGGHGMQAFRGDKPWLMLGIMREQLDQPHRDGMLAHMPPQMRTAWIEQMEPAFNSFIGSVRV